jgi:hypothetical protein
VACTNTQLTSALRRNCMGGIFAAVVSATSHESGVGYNCSDDQLIDDQICGPTKAGWIKNRVLDFLKNSSISFSIPCCVNSFNESFPDTKPDC